MMQTEIVKDVVCGMAKPKSEMPAESLYKGKNYYFCSQQDKEMFDAHPEHWVPSTERNGK